MFARLRHRLRQVFAAEYCPIFICWNPFREPTPAEQIRCLASRHQFRPHAWWLRWLVKTEMFAIWPLRALVLTVQLNRKFGAAVVASTGKSRLRQGTEQTALAISTSLPPRAYYQYALYLDERRCLSADYVHNHERASLSGYLDKYVRTDAIHDKELFGRECVRHDLPTVPILAVCRDGQMHVVGEATGNSLPPIDVFVKPARGYRGENVQSWRYVGGGRYATNPGNDLPVAELIAELCEVSSEKTYLIQPCLENHVQIADLSNGSLATVRMVTGRYPSGAVELIAATWKMPIGQAITSTHGLKSPVDLATGTLGSACRYQAVDRLYKTHPLTGATITGRSLPDWTCAVRLAKSAHATFPHHAFFGWDIALTAAGPLLLEGNLGWDVVTVQKPQRLTLGQTEFIDVCLAHLESHLQTGL